LIPWGRGVPASISATRREIGCSRHSPVSIAGDRSRADGAALQRARPHISPNDMYEKSRLSARGADRGPFHAPAYARAHVYALPRSDAASRSGDPARADGDTACAAQRPARRLGFPASGTSRAKFRPPTLAGPKIRRPPNPTAEFDPPCSNRTPGARPESFHPIRPFIFALRPGRSRCGARWSPGESLRSIRPIRALRRPQSRAPDPRPGGIRIPRRVHRATRRHGSIPQRPSAPGDGAAPAQSACRRRNAGMSSRSSEGMSWRSPSPTAR